MNPPPPRLPVEPYWKPRRVVAAAGVSVVLVGVLAAGVMASPGYESWRAQGDDSCQALAIHHYLEASSGGEGAQGHMYAAWAAEALQRAGETCQEVP